MSHRQPSSPKPSLLYALVFHHSPVRLLVTLVLLFMFTPFVVDLPQGGLIEATLLTLVMVSSVLAVGGRRRSLIIALVLVVPALAGKWINHLDPGLLPAYFFPASTVLFFGFIVAQLLQFIIRASHVDTNVLCAGVAGFLMLGLLWVPVYVLVAETVPGSFVVSDASDVSHTLDGFDAFYLSFVTLCTVGYGDVRPVTHIARMVAVLEAIAGLFYMALLIARLVSVYSTTKPGPPGGASDATTS
ncbi:MAG: potassium channel family protein [Verrucomicrobia bacterium]|jgi:hypothetical protein|nr:potassium channel family protein [Verrucomicrobiota bacterium]